MGEYIHMRATSKCKKIVTDDFEPVFLFRRNKRYHDLRCDDV